MKTVARATLGRALALVGSAALLAGCGDGSSTAVSTSTTIDRGSVVRPVDVIDAPNKVADTAAGPVGYREVGVGSPLLLIMGLGGSMDDWQPAFVATLAADHKVVVFDNAGVGETASPAPPLSITEMANQTSALISTLRLGRVAVLGWSMGGMIAQTLAVIHPNQVSKLVLAATQPGTGHALPIPPAAAAAAASANPTAVLSVLFPPGDSAALKAYVTGILRYPNFYLAPRAITAAQETAVAQWMDGEDQAGVRFGQVRLPTVVADGTLDELDPSANARLLAHSVPGATLFFYPDAGHAFLFQDATSFLPVVDRFLR
jgi:pimeloyl-ACP methyl ester carboxylesterase